MWNELNAVGLTNEGTFWLIVVVLCCCIAIAIFLDRWITRRFP
ncbi:hypothetical protein GJ25_gp014 [Mycobacterium phage Hawkeye]|uniref:Uncharacterized protein n=1 Tax=Mycobacterium phage Hawkeye TaxID=1458711 RepID=X2KSZ6_9CAUD|nr:hypothetical protein GJ25_gp014 [Mycobacterium phage Hawkeye]AHN84025.1 hypothetical protein PBI_HAWKEYE_14 [Mycobacterium phage Hawkeye]